MLHYYIYDSHITFVTANAMDGSHISNSPHGCYWTALNGAFCNVYWTLLAAINGAIFIVTFVKNIKDIAEANMGVSYQRHGSVKLCGNNSSFSLGKI